MIRFTDNIFFRLMGRMADLVILNLLWLCCSLPVVTMGAATAALYSVMLRLVKMKKDIFFPAFSKPFGKILYKAPSFGYCCWQGGLCWGWIYGFWVCSRD